MHIVNLYIVHMHRVHMHSVHMHSVQMHSVSMYSVHMHSVHLHSIHLYRTCTLHLHLQVSLPREAEDRSIPNKYYILQPRSARSKVCKHCTLQTADCRLYISPCQNKTLYKYRLKIRD